MHVPRQALRLCFVAAITNFSLMWGQDLNHRCKLHLNHVQLMICLAYYCYHLHVRRGNTDIIQMYMKLQKFGAKSATTDSCFGLIGPHQCTYTCIHKYTLHVYTMHAVVTLADQGRVRAWPVCHLLHY